MYQGPDQSWLRRPRLMSDEVLDQTIRRIKNHVEAHKLRTISVILHGGEPLLAGYDFLEKLFERFTQTLGAKVEFGMQSNLTLLTPEIVNLLYRFRTTIGVSLDGPRDANDRHRLTHGGVSSFDEVIAGLDLLRATREGQRVFSGILTVVDVKNDPIEIYEFLKSLQPKGIHLLLPDATHENWPSGKNDWGETPYADWLIRLFEYWWEQSAPIPIRIFENIISLLLGGESDDEALGLGTADLVVIETDGAIEGVDTLKVSYAGAGDLGLNVFDNDIDEAAVHPKIRIRFSPVTALSKTCSNCEIVGICGGGYLPHRYSEDQGYCNPSIYCTDLMKLIGHIRTKLKLTLQQTSITYS